MCNIPEAGEFHDYHTYMLTVMETEPHHEHFDGDDYEDLINFLLDKLRSQPTAPEPDWSIAPKWAEWWAQDSSTFPLGKNAGWYEAQPNCGDNGQWWNDRPGMVQNMRVDDLPLGIDWRTTLRKRPEVEIDG
jgi:hypothetical protein